MTAELRLLLASARHLPTDEDGVAIRRMLADGIDWTLFARIAVEQGLAGLVGQTLARVVPDMVPNELRAAFRAYARQTRQTNRALFVELAGMLEALEKAGLAAIALPSPVLTVTSESGLGLRAVRHLDVLVHGDQLAPSLMMLRSLGYERDRQLTDAQLNLLQRIQGNELLAKKAFGVTLALRTRLAPIEMVLDINYSGLWKRAAGVTVSSRTITALAPEDALLALAVIDGTELWCRPRLACDVACFIQSHPNLDWAVLLERAAKQGCQRMVVLAAALARRHFGAVLPDAVAALEAGDPALTTTAKHIEARWLGDAPATGTGTVNSNRELRWLHDGTMRRIRHIGWRLVVPRPSHVSRVPLPTSLTRLPAYVPIKIVDEILLRPAVTGWRALRAQAKRPRGALTIGAANTDTGRSAELTLDPRSAGHQVPSKPTQVSFEFQPADKPMVLFNWQPSSYFGWGVYGINLMLHWARRPDLALCCARLIKDDHLALNPIERMVIDPVLRRSRDIRGELSGVEGTAAISCLVLDALGNNLEGGGRIKLIGAPSIAMVFFESTMFDASAHERARRYPLIVSGSTWNREVLRDLGIEQVQTVVQGVDTTHFHPGPRAWLFGDRFVVFSGGKLERRKGQDLVVQAFRVFAQRHSDALLVTGWASPWPRLARSLEQNPSVSPILFRADGQVDVVAWLEANGIAKRQVLDLGRVPNAEMPRILREADVALFPNRAEGGTNLVAMECMACGLPTILSANTGHLDLIRGGNSYALDAQAPIPDPRCQGWGESNVDEIIEALEAAYCDRAEAQQRGRRGAAMLAEMSWRRQLDKLAELIRPYLN
jgi:glycosyltransferase involved in cell wall biosynthesis